MTAEGIRGAIESGEAAGRAVGENHAHAHVSHAAAVSVITKGWDSARERSRDLHRAGALLASRGADLVTGDGLVADSLRDLLLHELDAMVSDSDLPASVARLMEQMHHRVVCDFRSFDRFAADLIEKLAVVHRSRFGLLVGFARSCGRSRRRGLLLDSETVTALYALELVGLVVRLQLQLGPGSVSGRWGTDAMGLLIADAANALALRSLYRLSSVRCYDLSALCESVFLSAAKPSERERAFFYLYRAAGRLGSAESRFTVVDECALLLARMELRDDATQSTASVIDACSKLRLQGDLRRFLCFASSVQGGRAASRADQLPLGAHAVDPS
jgi:hypothetical protein